MATPSGMHPSQTIKAAKNGIHICTEKPMATKWEEEEDGKECQKAGVKLFVVKQNRYNQTLKLLKNRFKRIGLVVFQ